MTKNCFSHNSFSLTAGDDDPGGFTLRFDDVQRFRCGRLCHVDITECETKHKK